MLKNTAKIALSAVAVTFLLTGCHETFKVDHNPSTEQASYNGDYKQPFVSRTANNASQAPALVVTEEPAPRVVYHRGSRDTVLDVASDMHATSYVAPDNSPMVETLVSRKIHELSNSLIGLQQSVMSHDDNLAALQRDSVAFAEEYYKYIASISASLQSGTTPGNPVLIEQWNDAQDKLNSLAQSAGLLNELATNITNEASKSSFLLDSTRATFGLSGAVEEDHENLIALEDEVNQTIVRINRLLNEANDEINRRTTYLRSERLNMQSISLAIANGELYGQSLSNRLFMRAASAGASSQSNTPPIANPSGMLAGRRPLVIIRFDRQNVEFEQAVYNAVSQALEKKPSALFDLVAVSPDRGNAAKAALSASSARKNGENVLRTLTQMGLPMERITLNAATSDSAVNSEVHIYVR